MVASKNSRDGTKGRVWYWGPRGMGHDPSPAITSPVTLSNHSISVRPQFLLFICSCVHSKDFCEVPY